MDNAMNDLHNLTIPPGKQKIAINMQSQFRRYFQPPPGDTGLRLNAIGIDEWMTPGFIHRPGGTDDWLLMAFPAGVEVRAAFRTVRLEQEATIIWKAGAGHFYGCGENRWRHSWLHFTGDVEPLLERRHITSGLFFMPYEYIRERLMVLADEVNRNRPLLPAILTNLFDNLLCEVARRKTPEIPEALTAVRRLIEREFRRALPLAELAARAGYSPSHFSAEFRRHFGLPPGAYRIELCMREAECLLCDENQSVKAVAASLGFRDIFYFSRLFRRKHGVSPKEYRNRHQADQ